MPKATHMMMPIGVAVAAGALFAVAHPHFVAAGSPTAFEESFRVLNHEVTLGARIRRLDEHVHPAAATACELTVDTVYVLLVPTTHAAGGAP